MLLGGITFSVIQVIQAATKPNPGHFVSEIGCDTNFCVATTTGAVGIGTESPDSNHKLTVQGSFRSQGAYIEGNVNIGTLGGIYTLKVNDKKVCLADGTNCLPSGVSSVSNSDGTLNVSPTTGAVVSSLNLAHANAWTSSQTFNANTNFPGSGVWNNSGLVGIGTTMPNSRLQVYGGGGLSGNSIATYADSDYSALYAEQSGPGYAGYFSGKVGITGNLTVGVGGEGKLTVGIIDPIYSIDGSKYSTYVSGMTGAKEETVGVLKLMEGKYIIDFNGIEKGSDLWLFYRVTDFGENWDKLAVFLSGEGPGKVWYIKNTVENQLVIYSEEPMSVSYRLTAPRFDWNKWLNISEDGDVTGLTVGDVVNDRYKQTVEISNQSSDTVGQTEKDLFEEFINKVQQSLASIGVVVENEIVKLKELVADMVRTNNIEIEGKIQLRDQTTSDIYCIWIDQGEWVKIKGRCDSVSTGVEGK